MPEEKQTCRWAALSLSSIAEVFLTDILLPRDDPHDIKHQLVALSSTKSASEAQQWLQKINGTVPEEIEIYEDWQRMLQRADFDVVYISTPHPMHYQHTTYALEMKRNVLVEKPATMNAAQFVQLAGLAKAQGVVLMEAMWTRYLPAVRHLERDLLPRIGEVRRVYADFSFPIVSPELPHSSRFLDKAAGAGSLLDQGVYALMWAELSLHCGTDSEDEEARLLCANSMSVPGVPGAVDDIDTIVLAKHRSAVQQAVAIVTTSMTLPGSSKPSFYQRLQAAKSAPSIRIEGTRASVAVPFPPIRPEELHVMWYDEEHLDADGGETDEVIRLPVQRGWGLWYQADVIAEKVASRPEGAEGEVVGEETTVRVLRWMDEARREAGIVYNDELERS